MRIICTNSFIKLLLVVMFAAVSIFAQDSLKHKLKDVVVTSSRNPISQSEVNRSTEKIDSLAIAVTPISSLQDILNYSNNVDLRQRGTNGVQADVGIRGGTFEQTLIMIDGIKIIDPQTGHHNLNLPLSLNSIERIEIVKGGTASIHGPNAFSGVINFISKRNRINSLIAQAETGEYGYFAGSVFGSLNFGNMSNNISFEKNRSDGYRANTEYDITNFSYVGSISGTNSVFDVFVGYSEKDFGANSFYSQRFPLQAEHTITKFLKASAEVGNNKLNFSADAYWRRNDDEFVLDKTNPAFYKNNHQTNIYGTELELFVSSNLGNTSFGGEYVYDKIESNNLGNRNRDRKGIFLEHQFTEFSNFRISISGYAYNYSTIGWKLWPGLGIGYRV
ncbi:MAG: TonB-dependent receptor plug domain-containing protein, partial [Melioribacteraceae bacterium]|nr:TonB-dependent receptor plug domain-containing protein [Melioribacteraceae bacterium]